MHVLLLCDAYPPEVRSASTLTYDFAHALLERGHRVTAVTSYPQYNIAADQAGKSYPLDSVEDGVRVVRVRTLPIHKVHPVRRGIGELLLPYQFAMRAMNALRGERVDVIEVYSPPLPLAIAGWLLKQRLRAPLVLNVQDLFPQNAVDLGLVRPGPVLWGLQALERAAYAAADAVTVHSPGNRDFLVKRGMPAAKVSVISNWVDPTAFQSVSSNGNGPGSNGTFRSRYGLENKFVMLFAGVLGPAQGLDVVVDAAWELRTLPELTVLLVGDGTEKARLMQRCAARGQTNVRFEGFVSKDEYPRLLAECDVGLVSITSQYHTPVVPGKLLGYMAGGVPVLAALNEESDGHIILAESGAGLSVAGSDVGALASAMRTVHADPARRTTMGERGRRYALEHFDRQHCVAQYENLFSTLTQRQDDRRA